MVWIPQTVILAAMISTLLLNLSLFFQLSKAHLRIDAVKFQIVMINNLSLLFRNKFQNIIYITIQHMSNLLDALN